LPTWTEPWNAPELQGALKEFDFDMIQQADLYSLGLLCLHILLPREYLCEHDLCLFRPREQAETKWLQFVQKMNIIKDPSNRLALSVKLLKIIKASSIPTKHRDVLQHIVTSTIEPPPGHRWFPWTQIKPFIEEFLTDR
jgi:hypothetical protein